MGLPARILTDSTDDDTIRDPHGSKRARRLRPFIGATVGGDVAAAVEAEVARTGKPRAHIVDAFLRRGFGLPDPAA